MPLGIVMVSVSKSSTFIVSRNGQKLPELMKDGDVQVVNLYEKIPHKNTDVSAIKLWIQLMKEAVKLRIRVEKFAEKSSKLQPMFNASTNALNFVILDPVLHV